MGIYPLVIQQFAVGKLIFLWVNHRTKKSIFHTELLNYRRVRRPQLNLRLPSGTEKHVVGFLQHDGRVVVASPMELRTKLHQMDGIGFIMTHDLVVTHS